MKRLMAVWAVAGLVLAGHALAGEGCPYSKKACAAGDSAKSCTHDGATAKSCGEMKAGDCKSCDELAASGKALRATGANFEVVKTKTGYIVMATAGSPAATAALRKANHERWQNYLAHVTDGDKLCKSCGAFHAGLKSGGVTFEEVETASGVITILTATGDEATAALKASCGAYCGLKTAEAKSDSKTATN